MKMKKVLLTLLAIAVLIGAMAISAAAVPTQIYVDSNVVYGNHAEYQTWMNYSHGLYIGEGIAVVPETSGYYNIKVLAEDTGVYYAPNFDIIVFDYNNAASVADVLDDDYAGNYVDAITRLNERHLLIDTVYSEFDYNKDVGGNHTVARAYLNSGTKYVVLVVRRAFSPESSLYQIPETACLTVDLDDAYNANIGDEIDTSTNQYGIYNRFVFTPNEDGVYTFTNTGLARVTFAVIEEDVNSVIESLVENNGYNESLDASSHIVPFKQFADKDENGKNRITTYTYLEKDRKYEIFTTSAISSNIVAEVKATYPGVDSPITEKYKLNIHGADFFAKYHLDLVAGTKVTFNYGNRYTAYIVNPNMQYQFETALYSSEALGSYTIVESNVEHTVGTTGSVLYLVCNTTPSSRYTVADDPDTKMRIGTKGTTTISKVDVAINLDNGDGVGGIDAIYYLAGKAYIIDEFDSIVGVDKIKVPSIEGKNFIGYYKQTVDFLGMNGNYVFGDPVYIDSSKTNIDTQYIDYLGNINKTDLLKDFNKSGTIYALYVDDTLVFDEQGGKGTKVAKAGLSNGLEAIPVKSGYAFAGYYEAPDGCGVQYIDATGKVVAELPASGTIYAFWLTDNASVTVTFNYNYPGTVVAHVPTEFTIVKGAPIPELNTVLIDLPYVTGWKISYIDFTPETGDSKTYYGEGGAPIMKDGYPIIFDEETTGTFTVYWIPDLIDSIDTFAACADSIANAYIDEIDAMKMLTDNEKEFAREEIRESVKKAIENAKAASINDINKVKAEFDKLQLAIKNTLDSVKKENYRRITVKFVNPDDEDDVTVFHVNINGKITDNSGNVLNARQINYQINGDISNTWKKERVGYSIVSFIDADGNTVAYKAFGKIFVNEAFAALNGTFDENAVFTGVYKADKLTLNFVDRAYDAIGMEGKTVDVVYDTEKAEIADLEALPSKNGYIFTGYWYYGKDGAVLVFDENGEFVPDSFEFTEDATLYAEFDENVEVQYNDIKIGDTLYSGTYINHSGKIAVYIRNNGKYCTLDEDNYYAYLYWSPTLYDDDDNFMGILTDSFKVVDKGNNINKFYLVLEPDATVKAGVVDPQKEMKGNYSAYDGGTYTLTGDTTLYVKNNYRSLDIDLNGYDLTIKQLSSANRHSSIRSAYIRIVNTTNVDAVVRFDDTFDLYDYDFVFEGVHVKFDRVGNKNMTFTVRDGSLYFKDCYIDGDMSNLDLIGTDLDIIDSCIEYYVTDKENGYYRTIFDIEEDNYNTPDVNVWFTTVYGVKAKNIFYAEDADVFDVYYSEFIDNQMSNGYNDGSAILHIDADGEYHIVHNYFIENKCGWYLAKLNDSGNVGYIGNNIVSENTADRNLFYVSDSDGNTIFENDYILRNVCGKAGESLGSNVVYAPIYFAHACADGCAVIDSTIQYNKAYGAFSVGAIAARSAITIKNCRNISENSGEKAGAIYLEGNGSVINSAMSVDNTSVAFGADLYIYNAKNVAISDFYCPNAFIDNASLLIGKDVYIIDGEGLVIKSEDPELIPLNALYEKDENGDDIVDAIEDTYIWIAAYNYDITITDDENVYNDLFYSDNSNVKIYDNVYRFELIPVTVTFHADTKIDQITNSSWTAMTGKDGRLPEEAYAAPVGCGPNEFLGWYIEDADGELTIPATTYVYNEATDVYAVYNEDLKFSMQLVMNDSYELVFKMRGIEDDNANKYKLVINDIRTVYVTDVAEGTFSVVLDKLSVTDLFSKNYVIKVYYDDNLVYTNTDINAVRYLLSIVDLGKAEGATKQEKQYAEKAIAILMLADAYCEFENVPGVIYPCDTAEFNSIKAEYKNKVVDIPEFKPIVTGTAPKGIAHAFATISFDEDIAVTYKFEVLEGYTSENYVITYTTPYGNNYNVNALAEDHVGYFTVTISGIPFSKLGDYYSISVTSEDEDTIEIAYSPLSYAYNMIKRETNTPDDAKLKNICRAVANMYNAFPDVIEVYYTVPGTDLIDSFVITKNGAVNWKDLIGRKVQFKVYDHESEQFVMVDAVIGATNLDIDDNYLKLDFDNDDVRAEFKYIDGRYFDDTVAISTKQFGRLIDGKIITDKLGLEFHIYS